jgi:hypothetical protein
MDLCRVGVCKFFWNEFKFQRNMSKLTICHDWGLLFEYKFLAARLALEVCFPNIELFLPLLLDCVSIFDILLSFRASAMLDELLAALGRFFLPLEFVGFSIVFVHHVTHCAFIFIRAHVLHLLANLLELGNFLSDALDGVDLVLQSSVALFIGHLNLHIQESVLTAFLSFEWRNVFVV